jgi:eukaryotic-like serine/threonine-protein kinase
VARLPHKDRAIRILRETLAASGSVDVGRHTGRTLGDRYIVGSLLGAGGMGEVYRGQHRRTGRPVAIKILHPHLVENDTLLARFGREAQITGRLGSDHIVEILDIDEDDGQPFLVLELLEGEDLAACIGREGAQPLAVVTEWIAQIAAGLEVAHRAGVIHRDLKPGNVFLCRRAGKPVVKVLDFGISKIQADVTAVTQELALIGTPSFMAPEQATGQATEVGTRTDIFALGGIAYFALTGERPFQASSVPALLRRICDEEPVPVTELRPELGPAVADVLAVALAKYPEQRYASVTEFAAALRQAAAGESVDALAARAAAIHRGAAASRSVVVPRSGGTAIPGAQDVPAGGTLTASRERPIPAEAGVIEPED